MSGPFTVETHQGTLEEQLSDCHRALCLIHAACQGELASGFDANESVLDAVAQLAREGAERVRSLLDDLPGDIVNWERPATVDAKPARRRKGSA